MNLSFLETCTDTLFSSLNQSNKFSNLSQNLVDTEISQNIILAEVYRNLFKKKKLKEIFSSLKTTLSKFFPIEIFFGGFFWNQERWCGELFLPEAFIKAKDEQPKKFLLKKLTKILKEKIYEIQISSFQEKEKIYMFDEFRCIVLSLENKEEFEKIGIFVFQFLNKPDKKIESFIKNLIQHIESFIWLLFSYEFLKKEREKDYLTSLYNRQKLDKKLKEEILRHKRYNQPLSIIMLDIDHFKALNDMYGHQFGDLVLKELGKILKNQTRATDIPARYGGEEFCIILPHTNLIQAISLAQRLKEAIKKRKFKINGKSVNITVSMGLASLNGEKDVEELLEKADKALYKAKTEGRDKICWN